MTSDTASSGNQSQPDEDPPANKHTQAHLQQPRSNGGVWRPGRSLENAEYNLGRRGSQQAPETDVPRRGSPTQASEQPVAGATAWVRPVFEQGNHQAGNTERWEPPLAVGAPLGEGLSRLEEADRQVLQWEAILANARETQPHADLSPFERQLERARQEREEMEECEENTMPVEELESTKSERIEERVLELKKALERNISRAAQGNIRAAISGYENGQIPCWDKWTLIYAGLVVDHCPTYQSFTLNRDERLDEYFRQYGEGWLWFEPPLAPKDDTPPAHLLAATWAHPSNKRSNLWSGLANGWNITMGFRRVRVFHSRLNQPDGAKLKNRDGEESAKLNTPGGKNLCYPPKGSKHVDSSKEHVGASRWMVRDDPDGPRCFFLMHLDSGASVPSLHQADLALLGIDPSTYPPQTEIEMVTASGKIQSPLYEMRVDVCKHNGQTLVGREAVWPQERAELGGIVPVSIMPGTDAPLKGDSGAFAAELLEDMRTRGDSVSEKTLAGRKKSMLETRLSGMLPFQVCYSAGAPGMNLWFGEDRRDVLGADRMPGQRRHEFHKAVLSQQTPESVELAERPHLIVFEHELGPGRRLRDADVAGRPGASVTTLIDGAEFESMLVEPRRLSLGSVQGRKRVRHDDDIPTERHKRFQKFLEGAQDGSDGSRTGAGVDGPTRGRG